MSNRSDDRIQGVRYINLLLRRSGGMPRPTDERELAALVEALGIDQETHAADVGYFTALEFARGRNDHREERRLLASPPRHITDWLNLPTDGADHCEAKSVP